MGLPPTSVYTSTAARDLRRVDQIRLIALVCSAVSVTTSIIVFYWFFRMDKLFRHRLIMLLIYGDLVRSGFYFVFAVYALARGTIPTESRLCQSIGWAIQYGTETSDYAVLVMAVHSALQIFRPTARSMSDGLYDQRHTIFAAGFLLPALMASLAFVNPGPGYESLGAFCQLPIRPFWYRLALSWVPRYLIAAIILSLAGAIYAYVGCEFRSYANLSQSMQTPITTTLGLSRNDGDMEAGNEKPHDELRRTSSSAAHDILLYQRRGSAVAFASTTYAADHLSPGKVTLTQSLPGSSTNLDLKRTSSARPGLFVIPSGYTVSPPPPALDLEGPLSPLSQPAENPLSIVPVESTTKAAARVRGPSPLSHDDRHLHRQRRRIHRQLRLMFIYPLAYVLMWLMPFVMHTMNYNDYYAANPLWFARIGQTVCMASMGFVDCLIFAIREKPWRNIPTSDGTIWGSIAVWGSPRASDRGSTVASAYTAENQSQNTTRQRSMTESTYGSRVARVKNSVRTSASDDHTKMAADQARKRLDLEKVERLAAMQARMEKRRAEGCGSEESRVSGTGEKGKGKMVVGEMDG